MRDNILAWGDTNGAVDYIEFDPTKIPLAGPVATHEDGNFTWNKIRKAGRWERTKSRLRRPTPNIIRYLTVGLALDNSFYCPNLHQTISLCDLSRRLPHFRLCPVLHPKTASSRPFLKKKPQEILIWSTLISEDNVPCIANALDRTLFLPTSVNPADEFAAPFVVRAASYRAISLSEVVGPGRYGTTV
jgi:hypothetical protein